LRPEVDSGGSKTIAELLIVDPWSSQEINLLRATSGGLS
jgi:hypothetical protein